MQPVDQQIYDVIVIGSGGAGLVSAVNLAKSGLKVIVLSKVFPTRSHTVAAKGGVNAPLGNVTQDNPEWFMYDTIKGGDWLSDQDSVEILCNRAKSAIVNLENSGVPFSRDHNGKIYQRAYGGQTTDFGNGELAYRACSVADRTGHAILHNLYQSSLRNNVVINSEIFVLDLIVDGGQIRGVLAWDFGEAKLIYVKSNYVVMATGGFGQLYNTNTSSSICTGDGNALALRAGIMLQDMEFIQFHPTGLYNLGILITEAARAEGGYLLNGLGERFMKNYAPKYLELASRDIISRAIINEISLGRGSGKNKDQVEIDIRHLGKDKILKFLPSVYDTCKVFLGIDVTKHTIPVCPSVHYTMGGIPTNKYGEVTYADNGNQVKINGLYAIGETASSSVHGANRLGCNSLLELIVFGEISAESIKDNISKMKTNDDNSSNITKLVNQKASAFYSLFSESSDNTDSIDEYRKELGVVMEKYVGVVRSEDSLLSAKKEVSRILDVVNNLKIKNNSLYENPQLMSLLELRNLVLQAVIVVEMSLWRRESRGAHYRSDYRDRDDNQFLKHSLCGFDKSGKIKKSENKVRQLSGKLSKKLAPNNRVY